MIRLINVSKSYQAADIETLALSEISMEILPGEFVAVMGPSGCGKSTLVSILGLLDAPSGGSYLFMGQEVAGSSETRLTKLRRNSIGFVFQSFNLIDDLSVRDNVEVGLIYRGAGVTHRKERIDQALERVGLAHRSRHRPGQLSGGQQQRVAVARAIVAEPKLILADEPTGNLDSANGEGIMGLLREINDAGTTVVMVTHSLQHAAEARRTIHMLDGRVANETQAATAAA